MDCDFTKKCGVFTCKACGFTYRGSVRMRQSCPTSQADYNGASAEDARHAAEQIPDEHSFIRESVEAAISAPDFLKRGGHWIEALAKWRRAGYPVRPLTVREQLHIICAGCPSGLFDSDKQICKVCGCNVRASFLPVLDKAALGTEDCPKGHWGEIYASRVSPA
jgi:hypothetical protein